MTDEERSEYYEILTERVGNTQRAIRVPLLRDLSAYIRMHIHGYMRLRKTVRNGKAGRTRHELDAMNDVILERINALRILLGDLVRPFSDADWKDAIAYRGDATYVIDNDCPYGSSCEDPSCKLNKT